MEFRLLGPVELWSGGQQRNLGPSRERGLLAILLLASGAVVPVEDLIDRLWDEAPPAKARESIPVYLSRLRKSLHQAVGDRVQLVARAHGYRLEIENEAVDVHQFRLLRQHAGSLAQGGDREQATRLLREADALWRGQALAGLGGAWMARMRSSLEEERRAASLERIEFGLGSGRPAELLGELSRFRAQYPLDEGFVGLEMRALHLSGRRADALALYRETRLRLIDEQGTEPSAALSQVHQRILGDTPETDPARPHLGPDSALGPDTLPPDPGDFTGRDYELGLLTGSFHDIPSVTVIEGMPGVGKTATAVRAARMLARRYADGQLYLNLHAHDPGHEPLVAAEALYRLLEMISVSPAGIPRNLADRSRLWRIELGRRQMIIILDDAASAAQIRPILAATAQSLILITARHRLAGLDHAGMLALDVLPAGEAVALFSKVCGAGAAPDRDEAAEAVRLCGYLPLAIKLTAGRLRQDAPPRLRDLLGELTSTPAAMQAGTTRGQLASAFGLSYRGLSAGQQLVFRRLGAQPCATVTLHAAAALAGLDVTSTEAAIEVLLDRYLLAGTSAGRFRQHDLLRGYAAALAAQQDPAPELRQGVGRLLDYYLHNADLSDRLLYPHRWRLPVLIRNPALAAPAVDTPEGARRWLESEWRSILQAARYAREHEWQSRSADLIHVLAGFLEAMAYWDEAIAAHTLALQTCRELADPSRVARSLLDLSLVQQRIGLHQQTGTLAEEAARIYLALGDERGMAEALDRLGMVHYYSPDYPSALAYFREAHDRYVHTGDDHGVAVTLGNIGLVCWHLGRRADGFRYSDQALAIYRQLGDRRGEAKMLNNLGYMHRDLGYHRDAVRNYQQSLSIFSEIGGRWNLAILYSNIGGIYQYKGEYEKALDEYRRALDICREIGDLRGQAAFLNDIGSAYRCLDDYSQAFSHHQQAAVMAEQIGDSGVLAAARRGMADTHRGAGRPGPAQEEYAAAIRLAREIGDPHEEAKCLGGLAETVLQAQGAGKARIIFRQALDVFEQIGAPEAEAVRIRIETLDTDQDRRIS
jgi:DNA-binding SARP family transcriptional activator/tetratricopeptide (TPR) repeat protein